MEPAAKKRELRVLLLEDAPTDAELITHELRKAGINFISMRVERLDAFKQALTEFRPDIVLSDYKLPGFNGLDALEIVRRDHPQVPVIMVTGALCDIDAVELIHAGAKDYVLKDRLARLAPAVQRVLAAEQGVRERKLAQEEVVRKERYYRKLIEDGADVFFVMDGAGTLLYVNESGKQLSGWEPAEVLGRPVTDFVAAQSLPLVQQAIAETLANPSQATRLEVCMLRKDGTQVEIEALARNLLDDPDVTGIVITLHDISERKLLDQALQENNVELKNAKSAAEKASLAKSDFLSNMSHELRTPLNVILGFTQLIESGTPLPTPAQQRNLEQILKAGWYLLELINEILDLALIESGNATLSTKPVSLLEVMLECRAMVEPQAEKRGIAMTFPRFELPYFVSADRTRVKQVLINLLFNAIKYNKPEGLIAVEYTLSPPNSIRISVRDTGAGLAPEQLSQLFQPFNRLGKEADAEEGTGIGLVVTKRLIELMGGTVGADSTVGVGSVFWFELSLTTAPLLAFQEAAQATLVRPQVPEGAPQRTLLYVEDNPANLELVEQLIARRPDLRLLCAADGNLGIEFARVYQPEVILMDINLPGISGLDAMKILRADPTTAHIPIIALSANAVPRDIDKALEAGFLNYLTKPIKINPFMEALDAALIISQMASDPAAR